MDDKKRFKQLEELMADMLIQQEKTNEILDQTKEIQEKLDNVRSRRSAPETGRCGFQKSRIR